MKNVFKRAEKSPDDEAVGGNEGDAESPRAADEIPIPDIYNEYTGDTAKLPGLRNINQSSDSDDEGFDPYDTAVLIED